jgi:gluconokinase
MKIDSLRSPYDQVGGLHYFGRMVDKIRLQLAGKLPAIYQPFLGEQHPQGFDGRCCRFLRIQYPELIAAAQTGRSDGELLQWAFEHGRQPTELSLEIWNAFIAKRGWHDERAEIFRKEVQGEGIVDPAVQCFFDVIDAEEGRPPRFPANPPALQQLSPGHNAISGLRSPYEKVGGLVFFGRLFDKIRLHAQGKLPADWVEFKGATKNTDGICCRFLGIEYELLEQHILRGANDEAALTWAFSHGNRPNDEEILVFNDFLAKRGWRDIYTPRLHARLAGANLPVGSVLTSFDFIELDEGRLPEETRQ